jgi:hypothetical protein
VSGAVPRETQTGWLEFLACRATAPLQRPAGGSRPDDRASDVGICRPLLVRLCGGRPWPAETASAPGPPAPRDPSHTSP